jgi:hypothetical protein
VELVEGVELKFLGSWARRVRVEGIWLDENLDPEPQTRYTSH